MKPKRIFVAGPYTSGDVAQNVRNAVLAANLLTQVGYIPYVPHLTHFWHLLCPHPIGFWYHLHLDWLEACDCLLRLPGESIGADREVERALELGIPVYLKIHDLPYLLLGPIPVGDDSNTPEAGP